MGIFFLSSVMGTKFCCHLDVAGSREGVLTGWFLGASIP